MAPPRRSVALRRRYGIRRQLTVDAIGRIVAARRRGKDADWRRRTVKLLRSLFLDGWTFEDIDFPFEKEYFGTPCEATLRKMMAEVDDEVTEAEAGQSEPSLEELSEEGDDLTEDDHDEDGDDHFHAFHFEDPADDALIAALDNIGFEEEAPDGSADAPVTVAHNGNQHAGLGGFGIEEADHDIAPVAVDADNDVAGLTDDVEAAGGLNHAAPLVKGTDGVYRHGDATSGDCYDFAGDKELTVIRVVNTVNEEKPPEIEYITSSELSESVRKCAKDWLKQNRCVRCTCTDGCTDETRCDCRRKTIAQKAWIKNKDDRPVANGYDGNKRLMEYMETGIMECNDGCACRTQGCANSASSEQMPYPLELFKTKDCGWGVRARVDIPAGSFIAKYVGEVLSDVDADKRPDHSYHALLRWAALRAHSRVKPFVVDGRFKTNIAAFFNHCCKPNTRAQMLFTESRVDKLPELALFAKDNIKAKTELTWHYNYDGKQMFVCKCAACRPGKMNANAA